MKVFTLVRVSLVCGLALGIIAVWSSAAPAMVDAIALRGAGWSYCNCTEAGTCSSTYQGCEHGYLGKCHTGTGTDTHCQYTGETGGTCEGNSTCTSLTQNEKEEDCYTP